MASWEFPESEPIEIFISIASGSVAVSGEPIAATCVTASSAHRGAGDALSPEELRVSFNAGRLEIVQPKNPGSLRGRGRLDVTVRTPAGARVTVRTASADVSCVGQLADLEVATASGDVTAANGDVYVESVGGPVALRTASGDVRLRRAGGDVAATTASGDIQLGIVGGSAEVETASGDIEIGRVSTGEANVKTMSGDTSVGVARGAEVYLDLSSLTGDISSQLEETGGGEGVGLRVTCRSVSGDIKITRAAATADAQ
jgi:DUF4097 and DUF4098 domain-containing protein YvlB